uniref:Uncharacterized protein n=1 Tax=Trichinella nativa TaxID=6335 RepID=A0A0V1KIF6_9BILA
MRPLTKLGQNKCPKTEFCLAPGIDPHLGFTKFKSNHSATLLLPNLQ